jgi:hypothetical protein
LNDKYLILESFDVCLEPILGFLVFLDELPVGLQDELDFCILRGEGAVQVPDFRHQALFNIVG